MRYFLAHNELDVFHYGKLEDSQIVESGQPYLEYFTSEGFLKDRLRELGQEYPTAENTEIIFDFGEELPEEPSI